MPPGQWCPGGAKVPQNGFSRNIRLPASARFVNARSLFLQVPAMVLRHVGNCGVLAALQRTQISNDRPPISDNDVGPVSHHGVFTVSNRVENFAISHFADAIILQSNYGREPVLFGDSVACSRRAVTHRARDVETLLASQHQLALHFNRNTSAPSVPHFPRIIIIGSDTKTQTWMGLKCLDRGV